MAIVVSPVLPIMAHTATMAADAEIVRPFPHSMQGGADPARFATSQRIAFDGMNLHVGKSHVVHAVAWIDWIDELVLPAPACRQGFAGHGAHGELRATRWSVTCRRCRRLSAEALPAQPHQEVLFPLS